MSSILKKINYLLNKEQRNKLIFLSLLLFFGMVLEVFGLGVIVPLLSTLLDPKSTQSVLIFSSIQHTIFSTSNLSLLSGV